MNKIKALGPKMEEVLIEISKHVSSQYSPDMTKKEKDHIKNSTPERFLALAKTDLQTGLMYATRAVAQPEFF